MIFLFFLDVDWDGKAPIVISAFVIPAVCMAHVISHGNVTVMKDGVAFFAIKV